MSKAFDLVDHGLLFQLLLERNLPCSVTRFLLQWYSSQQLQIRWNGILSSPFPVSNGVRQGGVLSPILFTVYIDELLQRLQNLGVGCHWDGLFVGCLCYADDLALLAPSAGALRKMLQVCSDFATERNLSFNAEKTQLICFRLHKSAIVEDVVEFCGVQLTFVDTVVHLGHTLSCNLSDSEEIEIKTKDFIRRANCLLLNFGVCSAAVKSMLLQSFCMSFYGAALWKVSCPELHSLEVAFNKVLRRIWNLPYRSHRALTHKTASLQSIYNLVYIRCGRLLQAAKLSPSVLVQHVFLSAALHPWCFLGYNHLFGFRHVRSYCNSDCALAGLIREIRNDYLCIPGFDYSELEQVVYTASTF